MACRGVGTAKFPKESYLEDIEFEKFHFFIIISSSRFTADDVWIGEMAKKHRKKCFYVRTKLDIDIINDRYNQGDDFNEAATIENVRQEARKCLSEANVDAPIYLITTRRRHSFDFTSLVYDVNGSAEENAMQDILQSFTDICSENTTDAYDAISEKDQSLIVTVYKEKGATGLKDVIMQNKDKWKSQPLKIAVTGNSGSGKSSFINAFCGLSAKGKRAPVGVNETTKGIRSYTCTGNDKFILFDLPGVGTTKFPKESYLEDIEFKKFHFFIIISSSRFTENDAWLGTTIRKHRKQCFFVRTKIDIDISNESYDKDDDFNEAETIEQIRKDARKCLNEANVDIPVYLISTRLKKEKRLSFRA
ncbi:TGTP2-like protein [Mya arenaria]|uniref:TGTP2-like protein n=1 Tax=Mya arenaria TaxID=6604 RepID=A0ABY7G6T8_MYAAR|nr:TGTP2-like protein [Mya arenaria]